MNPYLSLRSNIGAIKDALRELASLGPFALGFGAATMLVIAALPLLPLPEPQGRFKLALSTAPFLIAGVVLLWLLSALWLRFDQVAYGAEDDQRLGSLAEMFRALLFMLTAAMGVAAVSWAVIAGLMPNLSGKLGLSAADTALPPLKALPGALSRDQRFAVGAVALLFSPVLVRLPLVPVTCALDGLHVKQAWNLTLRSTRGKTVPLLCVAAFQILVAGLPLFVFFKLLGAAAPTSIDALKQAPLAALEFALAVALSALLLGAMQASTVRHYFGHGTRHSEAEPVHLVVEEQAPELTVQAPDPEFAPPPGPPAPLAPPPAPTPQEVTGGPQFPTIGPLAEALEQTQDDPPSAAPGASLAPAAGAVLPNPFAAAPALAAQASDEFVSEPADLEDALAELGGPAGTASEALLASPPAPVATATAPPAPPEILNPVPAPTPYVSPAPQPAAAEPVPGPAAEAPAPVLAPATPAPQPPASQPPAPAEAPAADPLAGLGTAQQAAPASSEPGDPLAGLAGGTDQAAAEQGETSDPFALLRQRAAQQDLEPEPGAGDDPLSRLSGNLPPAS